MPKQTFYNLQSDKQNRIIDAAKKEFSENNFYEASINKIIKDAGIPRGSFYQYFENKEDLFIYLLEQCSNLLFEEVVEKCEGKKCSIFDLYLLIFDVITEENFHGSYKEFISNSISNININLIRDLGKELFKESCKYNTPLEKIREIVTYDNFKSDNEEYIRSVYSIISANTIHHIVGYFADVSHKDELRRELINQFELIKYGVMK